MTASDIIEINISKQMLKLVVHYCTTNNSHNLHGVKFPYFDWQKEPSSS